MGCRKAVADRGEFTPQRRTHGAEQEQRARPGARHVRVLPVRRDLVVAHVGLGTQGDDEGDREGGDGQRHADGQVVPAAALGREDEEGQEEEAA